MPSFVADLAFQITAEILGRRVCCDASGLQTFAGLKSRFSYLTNSLTGVNHSESGANSSGVRSVRTEPSRMNPAARPL